MATQDVDAEIKARQGRDAYTRHAWQEAYGLLSEADAADALGPEDLDLLAYAAWWCGRTDECIEARERAYTRLLDAGNRLGAGHTATMLAGNYAEKLSGSLAQGWLRRAQRLLDDEPESKEHGYLSWMQTAFAMSRGQIEDAYRHAKKTLEIGTRLNDPDLQAVGIFDQGNILIAKGEVSEGMALLEEAGVAAVGGELGPLATGVIYCAIITTLGRLADYGRAAEWTEAAQRWCERKAVSGFPGMCRVRQAQIMRLRGTWDKAEEQARTAHGELVAFDLSAASEAMYEIGEVRLRMGDLEAAEDAFRQAHELGRNPQPGLALLRLLQGRSDAATAMMQRALADQSWDRLERARLLPGQVEVALAAGDVATARTAASELHDIAETFGTTAMRAAAACAQGAVAIAEGDVDRATAMLTNGRRLWQEIDAPYEAACARLQLGLAYRGCGDEGSARLELEAALAAFHRVGAEPDARRAIELLEARPPDARGVVERTRLCKTFMFTDIRRSTNLVEAMGDEAWENVLRWHDQALRALFTEHRGVEVKHEGDGFFVAFDEPSSALTCAIEVQRRLAEHRREHGFAPEVGIGLHEAEATQRGADYVGRGVNQAQRISALAGAGEILVSAETLSDGAGRFEASAPRPVSLKGFGEPVEVVSVSWR